MARPEKIMTAEHVQPGRFFEDVTAGARVLERTTGSSRSRRNSLAHSCERNTGR